MYATRGAALILDNDGRMFPQSGTELSSTDPRRRLVRSFLRNKLHARYLNRLVRLQASFMAAAEKPLQAINTFNHACGCPEVIFRRRHWLRELARVRGSADDCGYPQPSEVPEANAVSEK